MVIILSQGVIFYFFNIFFGFFDYLYYWLINNITIFD